jgi:hypothetical protein
MGHDTARVALRRLSPRHGVLAGYATTGTSGMGGLVLVTSPFRRPAAAAP